MRSEIWEGLSTEECKRTAATDSAPAPNGEAARGVYRTQNGGHCELSGLRGAGFHEEVQAPVVSAAETHTLTELC